MKSNNYNVSGINEAMPAYKSENDKQYYTYADYSKWDGDERLELIEGKAYSMGAPSRIHQAVSRNILIQLGTFLKDKSCEVYSAPFDVRLNADTKDDTVVQPDLLVVCDDSKLDDNGCKGTPDMMIEILSQSSIRHDRMTKFNLYQQVGVREYWIVDPESRTVSRHILNNGKFDITVYGEEHTVPVHILEGCEINLAEVFD